MQFLAETDPKTARTEALNSRKSTLAQMSPELSPQEFLNGLESATGSSAPDTSPDKHTDSESAVEKYAPAVIGLLAANLLIGLVLVALAMVGCVRRGVKGAPKPLSQRYVPVGLKEEDSMDTHYSMPYSTR